MNQEQAKKRVNELRGFYSHLASYVGVIGFLLLINLLNWEGELWFLYPAGGWGIGIVCHAFSVFFSGAKWEEQKMQELTGWTTTQEELDRLSERTDTLISILSSVDWQAIDPDLLQSKDNLLKAQDKIVSKQASGEAANDANKDEVVRELEKLEAFVTSSKFSYYDQASREPKA
tara:strand:+ start:117 stop:638 length:522 start_codon:yes stop_codon:yes gene_type:complete